VLAADTIGTDHGGWRDELKGDEDEGEAVPIGTGTASHGSIRRP
jgi:hypothetical protein